MQTNKKEMIILTQSQFIHGSHLNSPYCCYQYLKYVPILTSFLAMKVVYHDICGRTAASLCVTFLVLKFSWSLH
jgi:hypothetical protein